MAVKPEIRWIKVLRLEPNRKKEAKRLLISFNVFINFVTLSVSSKGDTKIAYRIGPRIETCTVLIVDVLIVEFLPLTIILIFRSCS